MSVRSHAPERAGSVAQGGRKRRRLVRRSAVLRTLAAWAVTVPSTALLGAGLAKVGPSSIVWSGVGKTVAGIFLSPTVGMLIALLLVLALVWARLGAADLALAEARAAVASADLLIVTLLFLDEHVRGEDWERPATLG